MIKRKTIKKSLRKKLSKRYRKSKKNKTNVRRRMKGGFNSCVLGTINEPGLSIPDMNGIKGLSIKNSSSVIYRPNCQGSGLADAMIPN